MRFGERIHALRLMRILRSCSCGDKVWLNESYWPESVLMKLSSNELSLRYPRYMLYLSVSKPSEHTANIGIELARLCRAKVLEPYCCSECDSCFKNTYFVGAVGGNFVI